MLCRKHHNLKTQKWWRRRHDADGTVNWTSPLGFNWSRPPGTYDEFLDSPDPVDDGEPDDEPISSVPDPPPEDAAIPWPDEPPLDVFEEYDEMSRWLSDLRGELACP